MEIDQSVVANTKNPTINKDKLCLIVWNRISNWLDEIE